MTMVDQSDQMLGPFIQDYARMRWYECADSAKIDRAAACLGRDLCDRIDVLGLDIERLLSVEPEHALAALQAIEQEALAEDTGFATPAAKVRSQVEQRGKRSGQRKGPPTIPSDYRHGKGWPHV
jgi:hypothetical protein